MGEKLFDPGKVNQKDTKTEKTIEKTNLFI